MISPLPGATTTKPGSATFPLPGIGAEVVDDERHAGRERAAATSRSRGRGRRCCGASTATRSATGRPTGAASPIATSPATGPRSTTTGYLWLLGRVDDVMNVSGHRISTTEVESALVAHPDGGRGGGGRREGRDHGPGDHRLRHAAGRQRAERPSTARCCASTSPRRSAPIARPKTIIFTDDLPEDPQRQDHAPAAPGRRRRARPRRHDDARRRRPSSRRSATAPPPPRKRTDPADSFGASGARRPAGAKKSGRVNERGRARCRSSGRRRGLATAGR